MFKENIRTQVVGTLKIFDKETGTVLVDKKNAIHPVIWRTFWEPHLLVSQQV